MSPFGRFFISPPFGGRGRGFCSALLFLGDDDHHGDDHHHSGGDADDEGGVVGLGRGLGGGLIRGLILGGLLLHLGEGDGRRIGGAVVLHHIDRPGLAGIGGAGGAVEVDLAAGGGPEIEGLPVGLGGLDPLRQIGGSGGIQDEEGAAGAEVGGHVGKAAPQGELFAVHLQDVLPLQLGGDHLAGLAHGGGKAGPGFGLGGDGIDDAGGPAHIQLVGPIFPADAVYVPGGGGVIGPEIVPAALGAIAHDADQVPAGIVGSAVFQEGIAAARLAGILDAEGHAAAGGQLVTDKIQIPVLGIGAVAKAPGDGGGKGPVAEAVVAEVIFPQSGLLREEGLAPVVEHHGHAGGAAHDVGDGGVPDHLAVAGGVQQDLVGERFPGVGGIDGDGLTLQRVFDGAAHLAEGRALPVRGGMQGHPQLDAVGGLAVGAQDDEGVGVHLRQGGGLAHAGALHAGAPFAPGHPVAPVAVHGDIGPGVHTDPAVGGGVGAPGGHQVFKGGDGDLRRGPDALLLTLGQNQRAVADLLGDGEILRRPGGKALCRADADKVVLLDVAPDRLCRDIRKGRQAQGGGSQSRRQQEQGEFLQGFHVDRSFFE